MAAEVAGGHGAAAHVGEHEEGEVRGETEWLLVTSGELSAGDATAFVSAPCAGAISLFIGTTRNSFQGKEVTRLEYEGYTPMALKEMTKICAELRARWHVTRIAMIHRLGLVDVQGASVIVAVSSPHRKESLEAVQFGIDTLKATVPVWKKEWYADGTCNWKENCSHGHGHGHTAEGGEPA